MRVRPNVYHHQKVRKIRKAAKGFHFRRRLFKNANELILRSEVYAQIHRKKKKGEMKKLWIIRINAAVRAKGSKYSTFVHGLKKAGVKLNTKILAQMAYEDLASFDRLIEVSKQAS